MRFADFSLFSMWFSVFVKNASDFLVLVSDVVLGFPILSYMGPGFSSI